MNGIVIGEEVYLQLSQKKSISKCADEGNVLVHLLLLELNTTVFIKNTGLLSP
jgi:hypothetical protein